MNKIILFLITFLLLPSFLLCQDIIVIRDFGIWSGINIDKHISKKIDLELEQQIRFYSNARIFDDYLVDLGGKYKIDKNFTFGLNLRYIYNEKRWNDTEHNLRYNFDLGYKLKPHKKINLYYRFRLQENNIINKETLAIAPKSIAFRHRLKLKYKLSKNIHLFASTEAFRYIQNLSLPYWGKLRFNMGSIFQTKFGDLDLSYGLEQEMNCNNPSKLYYLKTIYHFAL